MEITPDKKRISVLVEQSYTGAMCLPNFQRDFVWTREEVADLLRSILRGYFLGSLLLLKCDDDNPPFAPIPLRGANVASTKLSPDQLVLDGQQRLTSLIYALYAPDLGLKNSKKPRRFFVDLELLLMDPDDDEIVFDRTATEIRREGLDTLEGQWKRRVVPVTNLASGAAFLKWRDGIDDWLQENEPESHQIFRDEWRSKWSESAEAFLAFEVPVVLLPKVSDNDPEAVSRVCAIFEKLNSTGVDLSVYDLLTARLYRSGIDLHKLWDEAVDSHPLLNEWSGGSADQHKFGVLVLRTLALMRGLDPKPKMLINLEPKDFESDWHRAAKAMDRALELVTSIGPDGFGVFEKKWLPLFGPIPVLAALRAQIEDRKLGEPERKELRRWYWCSVFLERYSSSVEAKSRRDYSEMLRAWSGEKFTPNVFVEAENRIGSEGYSIRESASTSSSVYSGIFCLLALNGARDWHAGEDIALQNLEDHHIFPRSYLLKHGFDSKRDKAAINGIVNRTLISDVTNKRISDTAPAKYLDDKKVFPSGPTPVVQRHFIDQHALAAMETATESLSEAETRRVFEDFRVAREKDLLVRIRDVCEVGQVKLSAQELDALED
ncbi:Domain of unknown function DUF262 [Acidimicrobiia bacterium]